MSRDMVVAETYDDLCRRAAEDFVSTVNAAVKARGVAVVALSGGSTPKVLYEMLATEPWRSRVQWQHVHFFWGDERSVPPDHKDSNYRMAHDALLSHVDVPSANVHRMPADAADADAAAVAYEEELRAAVLNDENEGVPSLDLIHLGMGDDGHTASLFPHTRALDVTDRLVVPNRVDKLDTWRMTFTYPLINGAHHVVFMVAGAAKALVLPEVLNGTRDLHTYPSQGVMPGQGTLLWLVDRAAWGSGS